MDLPSRTLASSTSKSPSPSASNDLSLPVGGARWPSANHKQAVTSAVAGSKQIGQFTLKDLREVERKLPHSCCRRRYRRRKIMKKNKKKGSGKRKGRERGEKERHRGKGGGQKEEEAIGKMVDQKEKRGRRHVEGKKMGEE